jgi:hypothetical protein
MPFPLVAAAAIGVPLALLFLGGGPKDDTRGASAEGFREVENVGGVQRVPIAARAGILATLAERGVAPAGEGAAVISESQPGPGQKSAAQWIAEQQLQGKAILLSKLSPGDKAPGELLAVTPAETREKAFDGGRWAVLAESPGQGLAELPKAGSAELELPKEPPAGELLPPIEVEILRLPANVRETVLAAIRDPKVKGETLRAIADQIAKVNAGLADKIRDEAQRRDETAKAAAAGGMGYVHTVRLDGDTPYYLAKWHTGDGSRWRELLLLNGLQAIKHENGITYATPWKMGQKVKLPLDWDVSKGPIPAGDIPKERSDIDAIAKKIQLSAVEPLEKIAGLEVGAKFKAGKRSKTALVGLAKLSAARTNREIRRKVLSDKKSLAAIKRAAAEGDRVARKLQDQIEELRALAEADPLDDVPPEELSEELDGGEVGARAGRGGGGGRGGAGRAGGGRGGAGGGRGGSEGRAGRSLDRESLSEAKGDKGLRRELLAQKREIQKLTAAAKAGSQSAQELSAMLRELQEQALAEQPEGDELADEDS